MRARFGSRLLLERVLGRDVWRLSAPLVFYSAVLQRAIVVPRGFQTDFASIPRLLWRVLPKNGTYDGAAVLHDYGYRGWLHRWAADAVFYEAMRALRVPLWKAIPMFLAVRMCGRRAHARSRRHGGRLHIL